MPNVENAFAHHPRQQSPSTSTCTPSVSRRYLRLANLLGSEWDPSRVTLKSHFCFFHLCGYQAPEGIATRPSNIQLRPLNTHPRAGGWEQNIQRSARKTGLLANFSPKQAELHHKDAQHSRIRDLCCTETNLQAHPARRDSFTCFAERCTTTEGGARVPLDNRAHWPGQVALEPPPALFSMGCGRTTARHQTSPTTTWNRSHKQPCTFAPATHWSLRARLLQHDTQRQRRTTQHSTRHVASTLRSHLDARTRAPRHFMP